MIKYIDSVIDASGQTWYVNDQVTYHQLGVRSDEGTIAEIHGPFTVKIWCDPVFMEIPFSKLVLRRRRTRDEIPMIAFETGQAK